MGFEVVAGHALGGHAVDRLGLVAVDEGADVVGLGFDGDERGPVGDGGPGSEHREGVGEVGDADAHVAGDGGGPFGLQVAGCRAEDGIARDVGGVEAGGADDHVAGVVGLVVADAAGLGEGGDAAVDDGDVVFLEGLFVVNGCWWIGERDVP